MLTVKNMKLIKKILLLVITTAICRSGNTQILNIDKSDTSDYVSKAKFNLNFNTGLEIDKQKITLYDATNTAEAMLQKNKELFIASASYRFTYNGPDDILNAGFVHLRYRHNYKNTFQPETFLQYQWDNKRGLIYRALAGGNMRYSVWKGDHWDFNAGLGIMYEEEEWNYDGVDSAKIPLKPIPIINKLVKLNSYLRFDWKASNSSDVAINIFIQTRPDRFKPRIAPHIQWNIMAGKHLGFSIAFSGIYDDQPVVPINKFYYSMSNSLFVKI